MTEPLDKLVDRLADELFRQMEAKWAEGEYWKAQIENALCKAIRAALAEPNEAMKMAGSHAICEIYRRDGGWCGMKAAEEQMLATWNATAAERLKELN